jgi:hypothetical protein
MDMTHKVSIGDKVEWQDPLAVFKHMDEWAVECCTSYLKYSVADTSDVSGYDWVATYFFDNYEDSLAFKLNWKR